MMHNNQIVTRIAPSPTGKFHVGTARTALFNYLFAKINGGKFLLRIEDTDQARSSDEHIDDIKESLSWLGLNWDNKDTEHYQSKRIDEYKKVAQELVQKGIAEERDGAVYFRVASSQKPVASSENYTTGHRPQATGNIEFTDLIHGEVSTRLENIEDFVILKSDGWPTFHLGVVVDDHDMGVTHVIRGDDHLSNTPKHILLYKALGWELPQWGHLPLILNRDKSKMSKRKDPVSVSGDFRDKGYLPEAMVNFLALLGWSPKSDEEFFTLDELVQAFDIDNIQKSNAVFDIEKLKHFNAHYLRQLDSAELLHKVEPLWRKAGRDVDAINESARQKIIETIKNRADTINDMATDIEYFFGAPEIDSPKIVFAKSNIDSTTKGLSLVIVALDKLSEDKWNTDELASALSSVVEENNLSNGDVFWPVRYALSGAMASPSPQELLWILGKEESIKRIGNALNLLK